MKLIILISILLVSLFANHHSELKVIIPQNWKPYYYVSEDGKISGYAIDIFEALVKDSSIEYKYIVKKDFAEVLKAFENGEGDLIPNIGISKKRQELFIFTQPTDTYDIYIYKRKSSVDIQSIEDLKNRKLGIVSSNICGKILDKNLKDNIVIFDSYSRAIKELNSGVIDGFCYPKPLIDEKLEKLELEENVVEIFPAIKEIKRGMGIAKENFHILTFFNERITELKVSGEYEKIYKKWFGKENTIKLTKSELIFIVLSFLGTTFTLIVIALFVSNKKKWLITKETLNEEIKCKTQKLEEQNSELLKIQKVLKEQTYTDQLTGVKNRKAYNEKLEELTHSKKRYNRAFSYIMFDIDDFKKINDDFGHKKGDEILIEITSCIEKHIRANDFLFRVGGEEFIILLSETSLEDGKKAAEKIRSSVEKHIKAQERVVTVSIGLTQFKDGDTPDGIYKRADDLMYKSKSQGKNRVNVG